MKPNYNYFTVSKAQLIITNDSPQFYQTVTYIYKILPELPIYKIYKTCTKDVNKCYCEFRMNFFKVCIKMIVSMGLIVII